MIKPIELTRGGDRIFARLWAALALSWLGDGMRFVAIPLLAALIADSPSQVALVVSAGYWPWMVAALVGATVDRLDAHRLIVMLGFFRAAVVGCLAILAAIGQTSIALLAIAGFLLSAAQAPSDQAAHRLLPAILEKNRLLKGNQRLIASDVIGRQLVGPPLGAALVGVSVALPLGLNAVAFALAALIMFPGKRRWRHKYEELDRQVPTQSAVRSLSAGFSFVAKTRILRAYAVVMAVWNLVLGGVFGVLVLWVTEVLGLSAAGYGLFAIGSAVGGLMAAVLVVRIRNLIGAGAATQLSIVLLLVTFAGMAWTQNPLVAGLMSAGNGAATVMWSVVTTSVRQRLVPTSMLANVQGVFQTLSKGVLPIGAVLGGAVAQVWGLQAPLVLAAMAFVPLLGLLPALTSRGDLDDQCSSDENSTKVTA